MRLDYDQAVPGLYNTSQFNGNIAAVHWKTAGYTERIYTYDYDFLDRLNIADFYDRDLNGTFNTDDKYMEKFTHNDLRGNMCAITRRGSLGTCLFGRTDDPHITIGTNTNLVTTITESGSPITGFIHSSGDLTYDVSGNNITNGAKGITYTRYNHLNLPDSIVIPTQGKISLRYDAHGRLLRKTIIPNSGSTTYKSYNDGIEYRGGATDTLDAIYTNEGRITKNSGIFDYEYYLKDYLGNTRVVFDDKNNDQVISNNEILQLNDYYPYGMPHEGAFPGAITNSNKYLYNGKELTEDFGWNMYRYGARWYDSGIERWTSVDPMAEKMPSWSPYNYTMNNPIRLIDPDGKAPTTVDPSRLNEAGKAALVTLLSTKEGRESIGQFANKGESLKFDVGGKAFSLTFNEQGSRGKDNLVLNSQRIDYGYSGIVRAFTNDNYSKQVKDAGPNTNIKGGVTIVVDVDNRLGASSATTTLAHEAFVHLDPTAQALNQADKLPVGSEVYGAKLISVANNAPVEHAALGAGKIEKYSSFCGQINNCKSYEEDVKQHKN